MTPNLNNYLKEFEGPITPESFRTALDETKEVSNLDEILFELTGPLLQRYVASSRLINEYKGLVEKIKLLPSPEMIEEADLLKVNILATVIRSYTSYTNSEMMLMHPKLIKIEFFGIRKKDSTFYVTNILKSKEEEERLERERTSEAVTNMLSAMFGDIMPPAPSMEPELMQKACNEIV